MASHAAATSVSRNGVGGSNQKNMAFVPEIWSGRTLKAIDDKSHFLSLVNRDYEGEIKGKGDTVRIHHIGNIVAKPYTIGARDTTNALRNESVVYQTVSGASMVLAIDAADYFGFEVEDIEVVQSNPKYVSDYTQRAGVALAQSTDRYIMGKMITAATAGADEFDQAGSGATTIDSETGSNVYDGLVDVGVQLDDELCPDDGRFIVIPSFMLGAVLKDDRFVKYNSQNGSQMREKGVVGDLAGFKIITMPRSTFTKYETGKQSTKWLADATTTVNAVDGVYTANTSPTSDEYIGIAGVKDAFTFADQITKTENIRLEGAFADAVRGLHVYGGKAVRPQWLHAVHCYDGVHSG
jgi:hypothetical protein